jgi:hypothetical protein
MMFWNTIGACQGGSLLIAGEFKKECRESIADSCKS